MKRERIRSFWNKPSHAAYLFIAPAGILLFVFCIIPLMASLVISTFKMGVDFHSAVHIPQELRIRSRGTERHSASD